MSEKERITFIKKLAELDDIAEKAGGYVALNSDVENEPHYNYPAISKYCKEKGIPALPQDRQGVSGSCRRHLPSHDHT